MWKMLTYFVSGPDGVWMVTNWTSELSEELYVGCSDRDGNIVPSARDSVMLMNQILRQPHDKPFKCDVCGASYSMQKNLQSHKKRECCREANLQCPLCPMKTKRKGNLKRHILFVHTKQ
jgi:uncharacterized Zn-finger protein